MIKPNSENAFKIDVLKKFDFFLRGAVPKRVVLTVTSVSSLSLSVSPLFCVLG